MTTGADIIGSLLRGDAAVTAFAAEEDIKFGRLAEKAPLPSILIREVSTTERQTLVRQPVTRTVDRIAVTVRAASYRDMRRGLVLAKMCCAGKTGDIGGGKSVSILTAGTGPALDGPGNSFERTQDFRVSYDA